MRKTQKRSCLWRKQKGEVVGKCAFLRTESLFTNKTKLGIYFHLNTVKLTDLLIFLNNRSNLVKNGTIS